MMLLINIERDEEVLEKVKQFCKQNGILNAAIVSVIGAVDSCCLSNMPKSDASKDILNEYNQPMEMSGNGDVVNGKPHIHAVMSIENEGTYAGHLHWARVKNWYVKVYILPL